MQGWNTQLYTQRILLGVLNTFIVLAYIIVLYCKSLVSVLFFFDSRCSF